MLFSIRTVSAKPSIESGSKRKLVVPIDMRVGQTLPSARFITTVTVETILHGVSATRCREYLSTRRPSSVACSSFRLMGFREEGPRAGSHSVL